MVDIVERLNDLYSLLDNSGSTDAIEAIMAEAAAEIPRLRAEVERLTCINANLMGDDENAPRYTTKRLRQEVSRARAEAFERAAQIADEYIGMGWRGSELPSAIRQAASGESGT